MFPLLSHENPETVAVFLNGKYIGETAMITDVEETARVEFEAMRPWVLARSVIRRVVKAVVVETGKEVVNHNVSEKQEREGDAGLMRIGIDINIYRYHHFREQSLRFCVEPRLLRVTISPDHPRRIGICRENAVPRLEVPNLTSK